MQRSSGGAEGIRAKTSFSSRCVSTARAKAASCPQSIVTKLVADGSGLSPFVQAISQSVCLASTICMRIDVKYSWSSSAARAPIYPSETERSATKRPDAVECNTTKTYRVKSD